MEKATFRPGEIILLDGLYGCTHQDCAHQEWGTSGRRFTRLRCGHDEYKLIRRRLDVWL
jgi:hypothetical protein